MKKVKSKCDCGKGLTFVKSVTITREQRSCPKCGKLWFVDTAPIDWSVVGKMEVTK